LTSNWKAYKFKVGEQLVRTRLEGPIKISNWQIMLAEIDLFIRSHRVAHLATADPEGKPSVVPICYAYDGRLIYSAVDEKPKTIPAGELKRLLNIQSNPNVSLVIDDYSDDWSKLAYVQIRGRSEVLHPTGEDAPEHQRAVGLLREKYDQYRSMAIDARPMIKIIPLKSRLWRGN
jgi:PPOX class probable F420-dependent enzyme